MRNKLIIIIGLFVANMSIDIVAASIYTSDGSEISNQSSVCANDTYEYVSDKLNIEMEILMSDRNLLLQSQNAINGNIKFMLPVVDYPLNIRVYNYTDDSKELIDSYNFEVTDCGYEQVVSDFDATVPQVTYTLNNGIISFQVPDIEDYELYINQVEENDDQKSRKLKFKNGVAEYEINEEIIQITEKYPNEEGVIENHYFEYNTKEDVTRSLSSFTLSVISPLQYINYNLVIRILLALIVLVTLILIKIKLQKKYKKLKRREKRKKAIASQKKKQMMAAQGNKIANSNETPSQLYAQTVGAIDRKKNKKK